MPTIVLFFQDNGLSLQDIMVIQAVYSVSIAIIEIPSGYVADIIGRKNSMIIGTAFGTIGMIIYTFSFGFWGFLAAALSLGIGQSFVSGSDTALMYDSLAELDRKDDFVKYEGRSIAFGNFAEAIAFIIGGFLAEISLRTPFYYQSVIAFLGFIVALLLIEPPTKKMSKANPLQNIKYIIGHSLKHNKALKWSIIYSSVIGVTTLMMAWMVQPFYISIDLDVKYFGIAGAILNLLVAATSFYAYRIEKIISEQYLLLFILISLSATYFVLSQYVSYWCFAALAIFYLVRGIATPVLRDYINKYTSSEIRATVMSIRSFLIRILFATLSPLLGYIADVYTLTTSFLLAGIIFFVIGSITFLCYNINLKKRSFKSP